MKNITDKIKTIKVGNVQDFEFPTLEKIENDISLFTNLIDNAIKFFD
jgi:hypothetical protein